MVCIKKKKVDTPVIVSSDLTAMRRSRPDLARGRALAGEGTGPTTTLSPALLEYRHTPGRPAYSEAVRVAFLDAYCQYQTISHAAQAVGVGHRTVRHWIEDDADFRDALRDARQMFTDEVKYHMVQRLRANQDSNPVPTFFWLQHQDREFMPKARPQVSITVTDQRFQKIVHVIAEAPAADARARSLPALDPHPDAAEVL